MTTEINYYQDDMTEQVAIVKDGQLDDFFIAETCAPNLNEAIFKARVTEVVSTIAAAFVDIGGGSSAYLPLKEIVHIDSIQAGRELLVQVTSEAKVDKGLRVSANIGLVSRYMVLKPYAKTSRLSPRITDAEQRADFERFLELLSEQHGMGVVLRTCAVQLSLDELEAHYHSQYQRWQELYQSYTTQQALGMLVEGPRVDDYVRREFADADVHIIDKGCALLEDDIYPQLISSLSDEVELSSGGSIVIESTRALHAIDVNSGRAKASKYATNCAAAEHIAREIRIRNLSGIIVIDFMRMADPKQQTQLLTQLKQALAVDLVSTKVLGYTKSGLIELIRQRVAKPLSEYQSYLQASS